MTAIAWGLPGEKTWETGTDRGVLYLAEDEGYPWNGLVSVEETPSGGELESYYYDGVKYMDWIMSEDYHAVLTAFSAPPEFAVCDGLKVLAAGLFATHQPRARFGLTYRTKIGNDLDGLDFAYKIHVLYNLTASPSTKTYQTIAENPEPTQLSWEINGVPPNSPDYKPTAHLIIDSRYADPAYLNLFENTLYGNESFDAVLPTQVEVISLLGG